MTTKTKTCVISNSLSPVFVNGISVSIFVDKYFIYNLC